MTYYGERPRLESEGASTLMLVSLAGMTGSFLIFLWPYAAVSRLLNGSMDVFAVLSIIFAGGAPIWAALFLVVRHRFEARRQARMLNYAKSPIPCLPLENKKLRELFDRKKIQIRILGDPDHLVDLGGRIAASPRVMSASNITDCRYVVLFSALAYARLRPDPGAWEAVLGHEVAHVLHRDLRLLAGLEAFLRAILWLVPLAVAAAIADSTIADIASGEHVVSAFLASILAKSSIALLPLLIVISIAMLWYAESYREALADAFAVDVAGAPALERAARILSADDRGTRPWSGFDPMEVLYGWRLVAMYGFAIGAVYGYLPSPLAYWRFLISAISPLQLPLTVAFGIVATLILYGAAFSLAYILTAGKSARAMPLDAVCSRLTLFAIFAVAGELITQTVPLMLTATPIFDRFPYVLRHDAGRLFLSDLANNTTTIICCTLVGVLCVMAAKGHRIWPSFVRGGIVIIAAQAEPTIWPQYTLGFASFAIGGILLAGPIWNARDLWHSASAPTIIVTVVATGIVVGSWFGLGGPGCIATSLEVASASAADRGDVSRAIFLGKLAARFSPMTATGFLGLAEFELAHQTDSSDAVVNAERALHAPYLHFWNERFEALVTAATAHLDRREPFDWQSASEELAVARNLWDRNTRLDAEKGVILFYNSAVVVCHVSGDALSALTYLVDALGSISDDEAKSAQVASMAMTDSDIACTFLNDRSRPSDSTINFIRAAHGSAENAVEQALAHGIDREEVSRFLRLFVLARAKT